MKPERLEEFARLAYEAAQGNELGAVPDYDELAEHGKAAWSRLARTLYAAAMRDAAGVANNTRKNWHNKVKELEREYLELARERYAVSAATEIATALETIAKDTDSADN